PDGKSPIFPVRYRGSRLERNMCNVRHRIRSLQNSARLIEGLIKFWSSLSWIEVGVLFQIAKQFVIRWVRDSFPAYVQRVGGLLGSFWIRGRHSYKVTITNYPHSLDPPGFLIVQS